MKKNLISVALLVSFILLYAECSLKTALPAVLGIGILCLSAVATIIIKNKTEIHPGFRPQTKITAFEYNAMGFVFPLWLKDASFRLLATKASIRLCHRSGLPAELRALGYIFKTFKSILLLKAGFKQRS